MSINIVPLGSVCDLIGGGTPAKANTKFYGGEIPWATVRDLKGDVVSVTEHSITPEALNSSASNVIPKGNVILASRVGLGKVCLAGVDVAINQDLRGVIPKRRNQVLPRYLYWWLKSISPRIVAAGTGATVQGVTLPFLSSLPFPNIPVREQRRIVAILDEAFEVIAIATANAEKNLANTNELFESLVHSVFLAAKDFEPVELSALCETITKGSSPKWQGINYVDQPGILFVTSENVGANKMMLERPKFVEEKFNQKDKKSILQRGDVLTNIVGASIGRTAIFESDEIANINQAVCLLRCRTEKLSNRYLCFLLNSRTFKEILHDNEVDNARANLSLGFFSKLRIPVPPLSLQREMVNRIDVLMDVTDTLSLLVQRKLDLLRFFKQTILRRAFSGDLSALELLAKAAE